MQCWRPRFNSWVGKTPWRREWPSIPVFLPREFHGQRILTGYSPQDRKRWTQLNDEATIATSMGRPSHCPLLSDPPQNGPWCCRHGRLWARAPRGHWMSPPLQDPATYDRRPSAPARRGTGRLCLPHQPRSGWASAHTPRPPLGTSAPIWPLAVPLLMPCEGQSLCPDPAASSPYPPPRHAHGDLTSLAPHERLPDKRNEFS